MTLLEGTTLGPYRILQPLGHGGVATVYKAYHPGLDRTVALKVISPPFATDPRIAAAFDAEARSVARLRHPNVIQVFDLGSESGHYFMVMEFVEGETLRAWTASLTAEGSRVPLAEAVKIVSDIAAGLAHAHERGIVHGDVKPSNILLARDRTAIVTDFGIAAIMAASPYAHSPGVGVGTPEYMSPEQTRGGTVDARSDQYALGVIAYGLLTGRMPYTADTPVAAAMAHTYRALPLPSWVDPRIGKLTERVVMRALSRDPSARYLGVTEFAEALRRAIEDEPRPAAAPGAVPRPVAAVIAARVPARLGPVLAAGLLAAYLAGVATVAVLGRPAAPTTTASTATTPAPPPSVVAATPLPTPITTLAPATAPTVRPPPPATQPPRATATPGPVRGALLFAAKLDGTDLARVRSFAGAPADSTIRERAGAIELGVTRPGGGTIADFRAPASARYLAEFTVSFAPASDLMLAWGLRRAGTRAYVARIDARDESVALFYGDEATLTFDALAPAIQIPGLRTGRSFELAITVEDTSLGLLVDGVAVARIRDARITGASVPDVFVGGYGGTGTARILAARFYALPVGLPSTSPAR